MYLNNASFIAAVKKRTSIEPNGCWLYLGCKNKDGYGTVRFRGEIMNLHRLSAHLFLGLDLNSELQALHRKECYSRSCWNPEHLYVGTMQQNMADKQSKQKM